MDMRLVFLVLYYLHPMFCFGLDADTVFQLLESKINNDVRLLNVKFNLEKQERIRFQRSVQKSLSDMQLALNLSSDGAESPIGQLQVFETQIKEIQTKLLTEQNAMADRDKLITLLEYQVTEGSKRFEQQLEITTALSEEVQQLKSKAAIQDGMERKKDEEIIRLQERLHETLHDLRAMNETFDYSSECTECTRDITYLTHAFQDEKRFLTSAIGNLKTRMGALVLKNEELEDRLSNTEVVSESLAEMQDNISTVVEVWFDQTDKDVGLLTQNLTEIYKFTHQLEREIVKLTNNVSIMEEKVTDLKADDGNKFRYCREILAKDKCASSGVYRIEPLCSQVYCDMATRDGGWIVFMRRKDGSEDFNRNWSNYSKGFGDLNGEFWLGLDNIHNLVSVGKWELLVNMKSNSTGSKYALYEEFNVGSESSGYVLRVGKYTGDVRDGLAHLSGMKFTTKDRDNDLHPRINCAVTLYKGGWWYRECSLSRLTHVYGSITWRGFSGFMDFAEMKMRRVN